MWKVLMQLGFGLMVLGCGTEAAKPELPQVPQVPQVALQAPWGSMALPIENGNVKETSATELHVVFIGDSVNRDLTAASWGKALEKQGWAENGIQALGPMVAIDYAKSDAALQMIVAANGKRVDVTLELK